MNVFRAALSSDFWITGIAIARYIPRLQIHLDYHLNQFAA
jgi:hypothetical protein